MGGLEDARVLMGVAFWRRMVYLVFQFCRHGRLCLSNERLFLYVMGRSVLNLSPTYILPYLCENQRSTFPVTPLMPQVKIVICQ